MRARLCSAAFSTALSQQDIYIAFHPPFNVVHVLEKVQCWCSDATSVVSCHSQIRYFMQEASRPPDVRIEAQAHAHAQGSFDAANAAQFVSHLEDDPLIQNMEAAGSLPMREQNTENITAGLSACASSDRSAASYQLPVMTREMHSRIMSILWGQPGGEPSSLLLCMCMHVHIERCQPLADSIFTVLFQTART